MRMIRYKKNNKLKSHILGNEGFTLTELIVTFALLAIFMTAVVACLPRITKIYMNLQTINHQKTICNTVSNQIRDELQSALGVESAENVLGAKDALGYISLIDESGKPVSIPTLGAVSPGGSPLPDIDLTGDTIEFVYRNGIIAQMDTKGFDGYTLRKKKLLVNYSGANAISAGALMTRYYEMTGDDNHKLSQIDYISGENEYHVSSEAGFVADGPVSVTNAIEYPYAKPFYEGYDLKTTFTIKKDAFYAVGNGTEQSPARTYVNYINYTLSLYKESKLCYSQDYVVNIQNAVPYKGTQVVVIPQPSEPPAWKPESGPKNYDTYIVADSVRESDPHWDNGGNYVMYVHLPASDEADDDYDMWQISLPARLQVSWIAIGAPQELVRGDLFRVATEGSTMWIQMKHYGYIDEYTIQIQFGVSGGYLTPEELAQLNQSGSDNINFYKTYDYLSSAQISNERNYRNGSEWVVSYHMQEPTNYKRLRERVTIVYSSEVQEVKTDYPQQCRVEIDPNDRRIVYVYGAFIEAGASSDNCIRAKFVDDKTLDSMTPPIIQYGKE